MISDPQQYLLLNCISVNYVKSAVRQMIKFTSLLQFDLIFWTFLYVSALVNYLISFLQQPYDRHDITIPT